MKRKALISITLICLSMSTAQAYVVIDDGGIHDISSNIYANESVSVHNSTSGDPTGINVLNGARIQSLWLHNDCQTYVSGGEIWNGLGLYDSSYALISSGSVGGDEGGALMTHGYSYAVVTGGTITAGQVGFDATDNSTIEIYGTDFMIDGISVGYGEITETGGTLTGTLQNSESLSTSFWIHDNASIVLVPEPATMLLLGLGGLILRKHRK